MDERIRNLTSGLELNSPASKELIKEVETKLGVRFSEQYVEFMLESNGAEGTIGESYLAMWAIEQIVPLNEEYAVDEFTPGLVYFGSDGGGMAYAFDKRDDRMPIVEFPFESIHIKDAKVCGKTFLEFLEYLYHQE